MAEHSRGFIPQGEPGRPGHETIDLNLRGIMIAGAVLAALCAGTLALAARMMGDYRADEKSDEAKRPPLLGDTRGVFPEPRLQQDPAADLRAMRRSDEKAMNSYGWVDRKAGIVRIPIERAMEIVARKGLPGRDAGKKDNSQAEKKENVKDEKKDEKPATPKGGGG